MNQDDAGGAGDDNGEEGRKCVTYTTPFQARVKEEKTTTRTRKVESLKEGFKVKQGKMIN